MVGGMKQDFIVIGAGIIGLATAERLLLEGATVTVLERGEVGRESSWAGGGILSPLCPWDYPDEVTRLTARGAALFPAWAQALHAASGIDPEYQVSGMLVLPPFDQQAAQQWCAVHQVVLDQVSAAEYAGSVSDAALYLPQVAQVRNPHLLRALCSRVESLGGKIIEQCRVDKVVAENGKVQSLATPSGTLSAAGYVVTAGAWSKQVLGHHALQLDIKPVQGQMLLYKFPEPPLRSIILQGDLYLIPRRDGYLLVGSTLEDVGFDKHTTIAARDELSQRAQRILPQLRDLPVAQQWAGLRPASPRNIPTIGRHPQLDNFYLNSGHFRYGVTMAPASAEILINEIIGRDQPFDVTPYQAGWAGPIG